MIARRMEQHTLAAQVPWCRHAPYEDGARPAEAIVIELAGLAVRRVGIDKAGMWLPVATWEQLARGLPDIEFIDTSSMVAEQRQPKSTAELGHVRRAAALSTAAMRAGLDAVRVGANARDVAAAVYARMIADGSEPPGFVPMIRFRDNLLQEHVTWPDRIIAPGDALFFELSASVHRYHAPMTRIAYVGSAPAGTEQAARIAAAGLEAVTAAMIPGTPAGQVYDAWQAVVDEGLGHHDYRRHHCGYQMGIGFPPSWVGGPQVVGLRHGSAWPIQAGMTFHVLSWLLDQQPADYAISDTVVATEHGGELLTELPREPLVIPV